MTWKDKIEQLAALLEKIPHPQVFDVDKGVYQPYFVLELRPANWEIIPYAEYTRLDGVPGKETRLTHQVIETQKVNINQDELNLLAYLLSFNHYDTRRLLTYGQPVGFLLDWLRGSHLKLKHLKKRNLFQLNMLRKPVPSHWEFLKKMKNMFYNRLLCFQIILFSWRDRLRSLQPIPFTYLIRIFFTEWNPVCLHFSGLTFSDCSRKSEFR